MLNDVNILIVEDDLNLRDILSMSLEMEGANVYQAENGEVAIEIIKTQPLHFIVSDVQMPVCDGVELLKWVKENYSDLPIFFLATGFSDINKEDAILMGAEDIFNKPFTMESIIANLSDYLQKDKRLNTNLNS